MLWSSFLLALREVRRNLLRSFLTILGIVIGVSAVITMVTLGNGATQAVKDQVSSLGSNLLQIRNGQRMMGPPGGGSTGSPPFSLEDVAAIRNQITGLAAVAPEVSKSATVVSMSNNWSTSVTGSTNDFFIAGTNQVVLDFNATAITESIDALKPIENAGEEDDVLAHFIEPTLRHLDALFFGHLDHHI